MTGRESFRELLRTVKAGALEAFALGLLDEHLAPGKIAREEAVVREIGATLAFADDIVFSSSSLITRYLRARGRCRGTDHGCSCGRQEGGRYYQRYRPRQKAMRRIAEIHFVRVDIRPFRA